MTDTPGILSDKVACVDYSAGKADPLVAYRWDGETILDIMQNLLHQIYKSALPYHP